MEISLEYILLGNGVLVASFLCVWLFEWFLKRAGFRHYYRLRLTLSVTALCAAALPIILSPFMSALSSAISVNATELFVAQYLKGNIALSATQVAEVLSVKDGLIDHLINSTNTLSVIVLAVFLSAALLRACYIFINVHKIKGLLGRARLKQRIGRVSVWASNDTEVPFSTRGMYQYHIVMPATMMHNTRAVRIALGHEAQHIRQHDVDWEAILSLISPLFVLNPAFWCLSDRIRRFREYSCDAALIRQSRFDAKEYCLLLLSIATREVCHKGTPALATSVPFWGREGIIDRSNHSALRQRVMALANDRGTSHRGLRRYLNWLPAFTLVALMSVMIAFVAKPSDWSHDRLMLSSVINLERLNRINGLGTPPLR